MYDTSSSETLAQVLGGATCSGCMVELGVTSSFEVAAVLGAVAAAILPPLLRLLRRQVPQLHRWVKRRLGVAVDDDGVTFLRGPLAGEEVSFLALQLAAQGYAGVAVEEVYLAGEVPVGAAVSFLDVEGSADRFIVGAQTAISVQFHHGYVVDAVRFRGDRLAWVALRDGDGDLWEVANNSAATAAAVADAPEDAPLPSELAE